jgi:ankyrin repeat protein
MEPNDKYLGILFNAINTDENKGITLFNTVFEKLESLDVDIKNFINQYSNKTTLLIIAVLKIKIKIVNLLIDKGADVNKNDDKKRTPLIIACVTNNFDIVKLLIDNNANFDQTDENGFSPLMHASQNDNDSIVKLLIDKGADVNIKNKYGSSSLHLASSCGYDKNIKLLIDANADINTRNNNLETPLISSVTGENIKAISTLIEHKANINDYDKDGDTVLHYACLINTPLQKDIVELLLNSGADVNIKNNKGKTPIELTNNKKIKNLLDKKNHNVLSDLLELEIFNTDQIIEYIGEEVIDNDDVKKKKRKKNRNKKTVEEEKKIEVKEEEKISIEQENINSILSEIKLEKSYKIIYSDCSTDLCGTLAITCFIKHDSDFIEMIGAHGLWEKLDDTYTNNKGVRKTYKKPIINVRSSDTTEKYDSLFLYKNSDNKTFPCISVEREKFNPEFIEHEWEKHGKKFDNYTNYKDYFNEICRLSKPILNLLFLEKNIKKIKENRDCTFDDYVNSILVSEYRKYLYNIKDTDDYKEFHFSVCKKDGEWNFCVNDDKNHY